MLTQPLVIVPVLQAMWRGVLPSMSAFSTSETPA